ncbi:MAG: RagB/SusD family nutrient uptake outer membrane protein, partial [Sphingomonadales bacterium]
MKNQLGFPVPSRKLAVAVAAVVGLGLSACDVTNVQPQNALPEDTVYSSASRVALAVTGVYNAAQSGFYDPLNGGGLAIRGYPFGAAANALDDARGEDVVDMAGFFGIVYRNQITPSSPNVVNMWSTCYALVNQANVTLAGLQQATTSGVITAADAAVYQGEMLFLRALAHHELVLHFSRPFTENNGTSPGVPYRETAVNTKEAIEVARLVDRGTVANDYTKLLADLNLAETNLPATRTGNARVTRATKGAAIALKQRIYLYQGNWAKAAEEGNKLISNGAPFISSIGGFALMATPQEAFPGGANVTNENIFSIENSADDNPGTNGALATVFGSRQPIASGGINARGLMAVSPILYNAPFWTCTDLRRTQLTQADAPRYALRKYRDATNNTDFAPIIRYAEVILNQAEAEARNGNSARALVLLNAIRNRAVATADQYATGSLNGTALIQAILNERRIELVGEGFRWDDIHRLSPTTYSPLAGGGIPAKFLSSQVALAQYSCGAGTLLRPSVAAIAYSNSLFLWPIPAIEVANALSNIV